MVEKIGVVGAGQLARMMASEAIELNFDLSLLAESEYGCAVPAICNNDVGHYEDYAELYKFAQKIDVMTFDHEHVSYEFLKRLEEETDVQISPSPDALLYAKDKLKMRQFMQDNNFPNPRWAAVSDTSAISAATETLGGQAIVKTPRGGYDGKGVKFINSVEDISTVEPWFDDFQELLVEEVVDFDAELSVLCARNAHGDVKVWDVVETIQKNGICAQVIAPAPELDVSVARQAQEIAVAIGEEIGITGVYAVEMFYVAQAEMKLYINELAMRPHNSGHWTQNGSVTSQFEQHLRAVANLPLGSTKRTADFTVMYNLLGGVQDEMKNTDEDTDSEVEKNLAFSQDFIQALQVPEAKFHIYGKESEPGRKLGHVNVSGSNLEQVTRLAQQAHDLYQGA
ncbi:MAG: 5-(carboxyamino)imidazole ribonucleotide synthase [Micrococcaceae bacterium]